MNGNNYILVTGAAGFIGAALVERLLKMDKFVLGIDNINSYYDKKLKLNRLKILEKISIKKNNWQFFKKDLLDFDQIDFIFNKFKPKIVINLAAQAGVRYSIENPFEYINSNLVGFFNILELCRKYKINHLI